jgi:hypothetical protein
MKYWINSSLKSKNYLNLKYEIKKIWIDRRIQTRRRVLFVVSYCESIGDKNQ